ncbi:MAG: 4-hydroxyphenylacetate 3-monooxygenase, oxygenase component [Methanomassiliicoccales archaeon]
MPVRNGRKYLEDMNRRNRELYLSGKRVTGAITEHPAFREMAISMAALYDMQCDPELEEEMTYASPSTGERVGVSFLQPKNREDLKRRSAMMRRWAEYSGGFLGRTPDYLNSDIMAMASAADYFSAINSEFGRNIVSYYEYIRENDLLLTHTLINPQVNRSAPPSAQSDPFIAARVAERRSDGIIVRGARMLATFPLADELIVFPSTVLKSTVEDRPYAMAFAIPVDTPGLKFLCREPMCSESAEDHPLSFCFDEQDAVVIFDDVFVPNERIFLLEDPEHTNVLHEATDAVVHMSHQVLIRDVCKTSLMLGVATMMAEYIGADAFQHVQEKVARIIMMLESMRSLLLCAEEHGKINRWGIYTPDFRYLNVGRNLYPRLYPQIREIIQQIGASGLIALPSWKDIESENLAQYVDKYFQGRNVSAREKIALFKLAWDATGSSFGSRQELYERFFFGDPVRMASALFQWYDKEPYRELVRDMLKRVSER